MLSVCELMGGGVDGGGEEWLLIGELIVFAVVLF